MWEDRSNTRVFALTSLALWSHTFPKIVILFGKSEQAKEVKTELFTFGEFMLDNIGKRESTILRDL